MLLKIESVEEIGRFAKLKQKAPHFPRLTLIYARNGYGKSTLCSVIRASVEKDEKSLSARRRLGALGESRVEMLWRDIGAVRFANGRWNACPGRAHVFDQDYVTRNVYAPDGVSRDHKRGLLKVVLGEDGVKLAAEVSRLDNEQKEAKAALGVAEKIIKAAHPAVDDVGPFCAAVTPDDVDAKIASAEKRVELARLAATVRETAVPKVPTLPDYERITSVLAASIEGAAQGAAERVRSHAEKHGVSEEWLRQGTINADHDLCPYCNQDMRGQSIVTAFQAYFAEEYAALVTAASTLQGELVTTCGTDGNSLRQALQICRQSIAFWSSVCDLPTPPTLDEKEENVVVEAALTVLKLAQKKEAQPLAPLLMDAEVRDGLAALLRYSAAVADCLPAINAARADAPTLSLAEAQTRLGKWQAMKAKNSAPLSETVTEWLAAKGEYDAAVKGKAAAQTALTSYADGITGSRLQTLNDLLEVFGANFRLGEIKANFVGREPNADMSICINGHSLIAGEARSDSPSFKTVLSAGDKFTLALALFIVQVNSDPHISDATVIFDDPFASQDMHRQQQTVFEICAIADAVCQVVVLSHDPRFLQMLRRYPHDVECGEYRLTCDDAGAGTLDKWSSADELADLYVTQGQRIREFAQSGKLPKDTTPESIVKDIRPFLETHLKVRFPGRFQELTMMGDMIDAIESAGPDDPYHQHVATLRLLNTATRGDHHAGAAVPDKDQLRSYCKRVVKLLGTY